MIFVLVYDIFVVGWKVKWVNIFWLWVVKLVFVFDFDSFNCGDYFVVSELEVLVWIIFWVFYLDDMIDVGKELWLKQEYFFIVVLICDIVCCYVFEGGVIFEFVEYVVIQLNDIYFVIVGLEFVCLLVDEYDMVLVEVMDFVCWCFGYINYMFFFEVLECWLEDIFGKVLLCYLEIICVIEVVYLDGSGSLICILEDEYVKMGELFFVMVYKVNGVLVFYSEFVKEMVFE